MSPAVLGQAAVPGVTEHIPEKAATLEEDEEAAVNYAGSAFNQDLPFLQFNDSISSPPRELDLDNVLLSDSLQVHPPAHFYAGSAPALTWYSAPFDDSHGCDDAALDSFIPQDVPDSDILDAPSTSMGLPWVIIEAQDAIYTTDYLQLMEDSLLPQSTFAISDMPPTDLHHHASPAYGSTSHPQAPSPEQADIVGEVQQDAMSVSMIDLQGPQYGPALPSRVLESERHPNPRSIPDLVDETRSGAHRDPLPSLSGVANSGNLAAPPVQSALSSTSRKSRKPRRTLDALKNPDLKHNVKCSGCDNYYSKKELSRHQRTHREPSKPCMMASCHEIFLDKKALDRHYRKTGHDGSDAASATFRCPHPSCVKTTFNRPDNLQRHIRNRHSGKSQPTLDNVSLPATASSFSQAI